MKILSAQKTLEADAWTVAHEPIADIDLMERAATACAQWLYEHIPGRTGYLQEQGTTAATGLLSHGCLLKKDTG